MMYISNIGTSGMDNGNNIQRLMLFCRICFVCSDVSDLVNLS